LILQKLLERKKKPGRAIKPGAEKKKYPRSLHKPQKKMESQKKGRILNEIFGYEEEKRPLDGGANWEKKLKGKRVNIWPQDLGI